MTLEELDKHVANYILYLQRTKAIRDIGDLKHKIVHSKKSKSFYVKLSLTAGGVPYHKTVRFSDHLSVVRKEYPQKLQGVVFEPDKNLYKRDVKHVEAVLRREIKKLRYHAHMSCVCNYTADTL